jgi:hypothetical protein
MDRSFLDSLLGPFPMSTPPVRKGFYAVELNAGQFEMWYWDCTQWLDSDDGLGDVRDPVRAIGWWGKFPPPGDGL